MGEWGRPRLGHVKERRLLITGEGQATSGLNPACFDPASLAAASLATVLTRRGPDGAAVGSPEGGGAGWSGAGGCMKTERRRQHARQREGAG